MSAALLQRQLALAGAALVAVVLALLVVTRGESSPEPAQPSAVAAPGGSWYTALAAPYSFAGDREETACGHPANERTLGVAHPTLPCGAKLYVSYEGREVLTQVVDRGTGAPGREFDVTAPLARLLELRGVQQIRWRFAASR